MTWDDEESLRRQVVHAKRHRPKIVDLFEMLQNDVRRTAVVNYFLMSRMLPSKASPVRKVWRFASKLR